MKIFIVVAVACFAIFAATAIYLIVGGEREHAARAAFGEPSPVTRTTGDAKALPREHRGAKYVPPALRPDAPRAVSEAGLWYTADSPQNDVYEDLDAFAGFTAEERVQLNILLGNRMSPHNEPPFERDEVAAVAAVAQSERDFQSLLVQKFGAVKAARFREYDSTVPAREEVENMRARLADAGVPLSEAQRRAMIGRAIAAGAGVPRPSLSGAEGMDAVEQEFRARIEQSGQAMLLASKGILSVEQLRLYEHYLNDNHARSGR